jgi:uncharacterized protein (DUF1015 family)
MAVVQPFKAWRPTAQSAQNIACVPYDVINTAEARKLAKGKPNSFLHVIRPEIDVPEHISPYHDTVYAKGRDNLKALLHSDAFLQDKTDCFYIYRLIMNGRSQAGIFGCVSVQDYNEDVILKHELTRPDKEDDRTKHIITQQAHAEPVMLTFKDSGNITEFMRSFMAENEPIYDFVTEDDITHTVWKVAQTEEIAVSFANIPNLYVADGHHRCASAARTAKEYAAQNPGHTGKEAYNYFPAVLFPMDQMEILAYNRVIHSIPEDFMKMMTHDFTIQPNAVPVPSKKGRVSFYVDGIWHGITLKKPLKNDPVSKLDISLLQNQVLEPMLGIKDQRTDPNIDFVGGIRGTSELERLVNSGKAALGISLYPTSIQELIDVSDAGLLMPPKSTWFEPKLRSGLLVHTF